MTLEPLDDKVAILPDPAPETFGRLLVPDVSREAGRPRTGRVLAVGPGRWLVDSADRLVRVPMTVKVGDKVQYSQYGTDGYQTVDDTEILVIVESRILGILRESPGSSP